jgi:MFS-type transporter involved in bile tolerance (Atg22 family)
MNNKHHNLFIYSEYVKMKFSFSNASAAATASVAQILPVILMPFLGVCVDRYGKRTWMSKFKRFI